MSDERDSADATGAGSVDQDADDRGSAVAAAAVTPPRPTGKRSRQRALGGTAVVEDEIVEDAEEAQTSEDEGKSASGGKKTKAPKKKKTASDASRNPFLFVFNYLKQVVAELRKVIWPNRKQMVSYTGVVLAFLVFMVALIGLVDLGLAKLVLLVFG